MVVGDDQPEIIKDQTVTDWDCCMREQVESFVYAGKALGYY